MRSIINILPDGLTESIKGVRDRYVKRALINEVSKLQIKESGMTPDEIPWITLTNDMTFYGFKTLSYDRRYYRYIGDDLKSRISEDAFGVSLDIVTRYYYPHALPSLVPPHSLSARKGFHPQHEDTVKDIPDLSSAMREKLYDLFTVKGGETFVDVGAFMGYGALRVAGMVNKTGRVVAIEADPDCKVLLEKNISVNSPGNVAIVHKAIWHEKGSMSFQRTSKQRNSLIRDIIDGSNEIQVETDSLDNILLKDLKVADVSLVSMTINGAEIEAIDGMTEIFEKYNPRLTIAGWYKRDGQPIWKIATKLLEKKGYSTVVGRIGRVYAWK